MMKEQLYSSACLIAATKESRKDGAYSELSEMTGLKSFVAALAGHVAAEAAKV
jgi:type II restriction enzyme